MRPAHSSAAVALPPDEHFDGADFSRRLRAIFVGSIGNLLSD